MKKLISTKAEQSLCAPTKVQEQLDSMQHDLKTLKDPMRVLKFTATGMENPDKGTPSPYLLLERTPPELEELKMVEKEAIMPLVKAVQVVPPQGFPCYKSLALMVPISFPFAGATRGG